jgi:hypothetical protein
MMNPNLETLSQKNDSYERNPNGSTGPRTPEGKARSSRNSTTHALTVSSPDRLPPEARQQFIAFRTSLVPEINPRTELEQICFERYAHCAFQLLRGQQLEQEAMQDALTNPTDSQKILSLTRIARYLRSLERSAASALAEYRRLTVNRMALVEIQSVVSQHYNPKLRIPNAIPIARLIDKKHFRSHPADVALRAFICYDDGPDPSKSDPQLSATG